MDDKIEIVGIKIDNVNMDEAAALMEGFLDADGCSTVFTPNSEILLEAVKDREFESILNSGRLVVPDGIGVVIASRFYGTPVKERVAGFDLMMRLMGIADSRGRSIYLLGGREDVAEEAAIKLTEGYGRLNIAGTRNGYFGDDEEENIINEINNSKADILLAALGAPKQEKFIYKHRDRLKVKIAMGVGGSLDVLSGKVKRAPEFYQKAGLEWLYRLVREPRRIIRVMRIPKFIALAFYDARSK
ncbi:MAG: WecB/TagA/CpsF family glycosyltransferase [Clostridiaceae bacterium]|nr:WecB/TagA/CpsF family glycosyltransferase [Clostridiaceae bacterium]